MSVPPPDFAAAISRYAARSFWGSFPETLIICLIFHVPGLKPPPLGGQLLA
jgi:hypothetical protein